MVFFITIMEWIGTVAFAVSGAFVAIEKKMDYFGICFLAIITAIGGGIIRDTLVNRSYPAGLADPRYAIVSIVTAFVVIIFYNKIKKLHHLVSIADGIGLAAFTAIGARVAVIAGHNTMYSVITMAVLTGTFGGVLRDVFANEKPRCFCREVYAAAAIIGAIGFEISYDYIGMHTAMYASFAITLAVRLYAMYHDLHLWRVDLEGRAERRAERREKRTKRKAKELQ